jgi:hypothetical protein
MPEKRRLLPQQAKKSIWKAARHATVKEETARDLKPVD